MHYSNQVQREDQRQSKLMNSRVCAKMSDINMNNLVLCMDTPLGSSLCMSGNVSGDVGGSLYVCDGSVILMRRGVREAIFNSQTAECNGAVR